MKEDIIITIRLSHGNVPVLTIDEDKVQAYIDENGTEDLNMALTILIDKIYARAA